MIMIKEQAQTNTLKFLTLRKQTLHVLRELALYVLKGQALHVLRDQALHVLRVQDKQNKNCKTKPKIFWIIIDHLSQATNPKSKSRYL